MRQAIALVTLLFLLLAGVILAQEGYDLSWYVISSGGGHATGGDYTLESAVLQGVEEMSGGDYALQTGFLPGAAAATPVPAGLWLPVTVKGLTLP